MGLGTIGFAQSFSRLQLDILLVLGDRFEMHAATVAAVPFLIPIAHMGGGAITVGAIDDVLRHSITKLSHLHFAETEAEANRVVQMGEEPWRVVLTGSASLDNLHETPLLDLETLKDRINLDFSAPTLLVTYHPVTMEYLHTKTQVEELLAALDEADMDVVFTYPNADTHGRQIIEMITAYANRHPRVRVTPNLGIQTYFSLMEQVSVMVGNSSSGIIEAASFKLPVVNIGTRQLGRAQARNVINVGYQRSEILAGIKKAGSAQFRHSLTNLTNPYGNGSAADQIVATLKNVTLDDSLLRKGFYDSRTGIAIPERGAAG